MYVRPEWGDCPYVVDKVSLGHTTASITDGQDFVFLVGSDADVEVLAAVQLAGIGERGIADLVQGI